MSMSDDFARVPCSAIIIVRTERQRRVIDTAGIKDSIANRGVLNPIIIKRNFELVAGERRLTASLELGRPDIPVRFTDELDPIELQIIELEENLKRSDLHWRDHVKAVGQIHELYVLQDPEWSQAKTSRALAIDPASITMLLRVYRDLASPKIAQAVGYNSAYNLLAKVDSRIADTALSEMLEAGGSLFDDPAPEATEVLGSPVEAVAVLAGMATPANGQTLAPMRPVQAVPAVNTVPVVSAVMAAEASILNTDFIQWCAEYSGPKFNFIHCDFPYGINAFAGSLGATGANSTADMGEDGLAQAQAKLYSDDPEVYWRLLGVFCKNLDTIMAHSAHLMFWFSMQHYDRTLATFEAMAPSLVVNPMPMIWVKSDNRGVLPDPKRGPRQIYETCLIASREDRMIIRSVSNAYSAPSDKQYHHSTKPEPVLRYFMQMFVDDTTRMLDPTCGSGSAIRAAESLGAKSVLGLELDPEHCANARLALRKFRVLRAV